MKTIERLLVLAPHADEAELGCGGTIARLLEEGAEVSVATFSAPEGDRPEAESMAALTRLGIPEGQLHRVRHPMRQLDAHREEVFAEIIRLDRSFQPDAVFVPSPCGLRQDHRVVSAEGIRVFQRLTLFGYELPWNHIRFSASAFFTLQERHLESKWSALECHTSPLDLDRPYLTREFVHGLARVRGAQVKVPLAEAFEIIRFTH